MRKVLNPPVRVPHPPNLPNQLILWDLSRRALAGAAPSTTSLVSMGVEFPRESRMALEQNHENGEPRQAQIVEALRLILRSARFSGSKQCQTLLQYLVEHSIRGQDDELKERIIGIEVFGRKSDYDTSADAIVRARVGEVRKRLAQYYTSEEGQDSPSESSSRPDHTGLHLFFALR